MVVCNLPHPYILSSLGKIPSISNYRKYLSEANYWTIADVQFMQHALLLAEQGAHIGEVPVGAVLVHNNEIIGYGYNKPITTSDPTAHAEIVALREACDTIKNYRLPPNTTLYVTLEPCTMCMGALIHARLNKIVFAASEPRAGMLGSQLNLTEMDFYNHKICVSSGLLRPLSQNLLKSFFKARRNKRNNKP